MTDPILDTQTKVELAGSTYTVGRLTLAQVFKIADLLQQVLGAVPPEVILDMKPEQVVVGLLAKGVPIVREGLYELMGEVLGLDPEQVSKLPAVDAMKLLNVIVGQEDLDELFSEARKLAAPFKALKKEETPSPD